MLGKIILLDRSEVAKRLGTLQLFWYDFTLPDSLEKLVGRMEGNARTQIQQLCSILMCY